ncbi:MAG: hypothetical protein IIA88_01740, partial [Bacteroidetes bacterium]|nr:hypothetical protein [Bacteroidota bacterium]
MKITRYFQYTRKRKDRVIIKDEWIEDVILNPIKEEIQSDGRIKRWGKVKEVNKYLRIVLLQDKKTV